jgi:uncharacterized damage-inducible protein DinB
MVHPLVEQLRFARSEFRRGLEGVTEDAAQRRFEPMNCISWNVGHLAWQEQRYWLGGRLLLPDVDASFRYGAPASTPALGDMWEAWHTITAATDPWLDSVTDETLAAHVERDGKPAEYTFGSLMLRTTYHYWYHTGENAAIRQALGHTGLPDFVGDIDNEAPYRRG